MIHESARLLFGIAAILCATAGAESVQGQDMNAAIDRAVQKYSTVKTMRGSLQQTNRTMLGVHELAADFQQQLPNLLSLRYTDPRGDMLICDGKNTWMYFADTKVANRYAMGEGGSVNLIGVFLDSPRTKFTLSDSGRKTIDSHVTRQIGLVPKQPMQEFRRAIVWIEEESGIVRQFEFTDKDGLVRRFRFANNLQFNAPVDASQFKFTLPRGAKIVDGGK